MNRQEFARRMAIEKANKGRILKACPDAPDRSGIYFLTREENGFRYAYVGQAKKLLTRLAGHLAGYQHIDLSIKKHGLFAEDNPSGWKVGYPEDMDKELLIPAPFENAYPLYLEAQIDYYNKEYGNYNNSVLMFDSIYSEYKKAYIRKHRARG